MALLLSHIKIAYIYIFSRGGVSCMYILSTRDTYFHRDSPHKLWVRTPSFFPTVSVSFVIVHRVIRLTVTIFQILSVSKCASV